DVCQNEAQLDQDMLARMLLRHPSGVHLLAAPPEFTDVRLITTTGVRAALALARKMFPQTVVDLEDCFHAEQAEVLRQATRVILVCRLDFTSLRHARKILDHLGSLGVSRAAVQLVANQCCRPGDLPAAEAEAALGEKVAAFIPHDPAVMGAGN